jgi:hypothetical protein
MANDANLQILAESMRDVRVLVWTANFGGYEK